MYVGMLWKELTSVSSKPLMHLCKSTLASFRVSESVDRFNVCASFKTPFSVSKWSGPSSAVRRSTMARCSLSASDGKAAIVSSSPERWGTAIANENFKPMPSLTLHAIFSRAYAIVRLLWKPLTNNTSVINICRRGNGMFREAQLYISRTYHHAMNR